MKHNLLFIECLFPIYYYLECLTEKTDGCTNYTKNSFTTKVVEHILSGFSMSRISSLKSIGNKHDVYRCKDCMKQFCEALREHALEIINFKLMRFKLIKLINNEIINRRAAVIIKKI